VPDGKGIPLVRFVEAEGIRGCYTYWSGTLNEEAADFTMYLNEKRGFFLLSMHACPSKGRLLKLKDEIGIIPYRDYCLHCDSYRSAVEKAGLKYIYNFQGIEKAACSLLIYDPKIFDGRVIMDEDTQIMDRKAADNEYFHKDFHSSMNMGIEYLGENYGLEAVREYLTRYTENVYKPVVANIKHRGLAALEENILQTYEKEQCPDAVKTLLTEDGLTVEVAYCPGVTHLRSTGREVSKWYRYTTETVMEVLAQAAGCRFVWDAYEEETGKAQYHFEK
jgi:hypothetical protein